MAAQSAPRYGQCLQPLHDLGLNIRRDDTVNPMHTPALAEHLHTERVFWGYRKKKTQHPKWRDTQSSRELIKVEEVTHVRTGPSVLWDPGKRNTWIGLGGVRGGCRRV